MALCVRVTADVCVGIRETRSELSASFSMLMLCADYDGQGEFSSGAAKWSARYPPEKHLPKLDKIKLQTAFLLAKSVFDAAHWQEIRLHMRIGTEEAWSTAMAAGMARATLCGMLAGLGRARQSDIRIEPDFASQGLTAACRCIFFLRVGDIMFAAAKAAVKRRGKKE